MKELELLNRVYPKENDQIKRSILSNAICCFHEQGIDSTTIDMIKIRSGLSVGTIYYHFKNKEGIIAHLVFAALEDLFKWPQRYLLDAKSFQECIYALVLSYADWVDTHPQFAQILLSGKFNVYMGEHAEELMYRKVTYRKKLLEWMQLPEYKYNLDHIPLDLLSSLVNGTTEHYCKYWLLNRVKRSPKQYRRELAHATWLIIKQYEAFD